MLSRVLWEVTRRSTESAGPLHGFTVTGCLVSDPGHVSRKDENREGFRPSKSKVGPVSRLVVRVYTVYDGGFGFLQMFHDTKKEVPSSTFYVTKQDLRGVGTEGSLKQLHRFRDLVTFQIEVRRPYVHKMGPETTRSVKNE